MYSVKEIFSTLQGEGVHTGRPSVFLRFAGCNLWTGREEDRPRAVCGFCDTDFVGTDGESGGKYGAVEVADIVVSKWPSEYDEPFVVCTGGEPMLQLDEPLIDELHARGFTVALETNGTIAVPDTVDWICVSPKAGADLVQRSGNELKVVFPQDEMDVATLEQLEFEHFFLQPMDGDDLTANTEAAIDYCLANPRWKLSVQVHKVVGMR